MSDDGEARSDEAREGGGIRGVPVDDGVDVSLIWWMLSLTPAERLQFLEEQVDFVTRYAGAVRD